MIVCPCCGVTYTALEITRWGDGSTPVQKLLPFICEGCLSLLIFSADEMRLYSVDEDIQDILHKNPMLWHGIETARAHMRAKRSGPLRTVYEDLTCPSCGTDCQVDKDERAADRATCPGCGLAWLPADRWLYLPTQGRAS